MYMGCDGSGYVRSTVCKIALHNSNNNHHHHHYTSYCIFGFGNYCSYWCTICCTLCFAYRCTNRFIIYLVRIHPSASEITVVLSDSPTTAPTAIASDCTYRCTILFTNLYRL
jgi:hypothetical protein